LALARESSANDIFRFVSRRKGWIQFGLNRIPDASQEVQMDCIRFLRCSTWGALDECYSTRTLAADRRRMHQAPSFAPLDPLSDVYQLVGVNTLALAIAAIADKKDSDVLEGRDEGFSD
jgi:hypothetical protein